MRMCRVVLPLVSAVAGTSMLMLSGCQSRASALKSSANQENTASSSFNITMAAVSDTDFAQRHQFYYYPNAQVYRDCDEDRWIWSRDGGVTWQSGRRLPLSIGLGDEIPFAITLRTNEPAAEHQSVAAAYPADDGSLAASARAPGEREVP